eukprot:scaffold675_cov103-Cylindrotheca_fusiformis.AAC.26
MLPPVQYCCCMLLAVVYYSTDRQAHTHNTSFLPSQRAKHHLSDDLFESTVGRMYDRMGQYH